MAYTHHPYRLYYKNMSQHTVFVVVQPHRHMFSDLVIHNSFKLTRQNHPNKNPHMFEQLNSISSYNLFLLIDRPFFDITCLHWYNTIVYFILPSIQCRVLLKTWPSLIKITIVTCAYVPKVIMFDLAV